MKNDLLKVAMKATDDTGDITSIIKRKDLEDSQELDITMLTDCFVQLLEKMQFEKREIREGLRLTLEQITGE